MNQDQVKELLLQIEDTELDFSVTFTGKESKKVNGLYKSDTHEILLHNKNFSTDNELLYTAIHEYTHHRLFELDGTRSGRVHTQRFWSYFHGLLQKAEEKQVYTITLAESPELLELTETIRTTIMTEDGKLMKELGRLLGQARTLCKQAGVRYEDYIDRVLCLPRTSASTLEKIHAFDVKPELGYEAMKVVANIPNPEKRSAAEELFLHKNSPALVRETLKAKKQDEDPRLKLENEKRRIERTIVSLQARLSELETTLSKLPVTLCVFCLAAWLYTGYTVAPLAADSGRTKGQQASNTQMPMPAMPTIPSIPAVTVTGGMQHPIPPAIQKPQFQRITVPQHTVQRDSAADNSSSAGAVSPAGSAGSSTGAATRSAASNRTAAQPSKLLNGLNARTLAALTQNSSTMTSLNSLLNTVLGSNRGLHSETGLAGDSGLSTGASPAGISAAEYTPVDSVLLSRLLSELEKLQAQSVQTAAPAQPTGTQSGKAAQPAVSSLQLDSNTADSSIANGNPAAAQTTVQAAAGSVAERAAAAELIRLRINGREIKNDVIATFCSSPSASGSFLYSADRQFIINSAELNETVYFLCRKQDINHYEITIDLRQDIVNTNSFLYKLAALSPLLVTKTSDILFWHYTANGLEIELVFRVAETKEQSEVD